MFNRFVRFVAYRPGWVLAMHAALGLFFAAQMVDIRTLAPRLRIQTEAEKVLPAGGEYREFYSHFQDLFGSYEMVFVGVVGADAITPEGLRLIRRLTWRFGQIDGVRRVLSLSNAPGVRSDQDGVMIAPAFDEAPEDAEELARIRSRILGDPMHVGNLVSSDGQATVLLVYPEEMSELEFRRRGIDQEIERVAREEVGDRARVLVVGNPTLKAVIGRIVLRDVALLLPLGFVFMALIACYSFRSARGVAVPLLSIIVAQLWTAGAMVLFDRSLNLVTFVVPILTNAVAFAYSVHVVSEHDHALRKGNLGGDAASLALKQVAFPVFLTAITTAAGFLSLCASRLPAIREFGAFCVVGVLSSLVASLTLAPAILSLTGRRRPSGTESEESRIERLASRVAAFDLRHRRVLLLAGAAVTVLAVVGVTRIQVSTSFVANLPPSHPVREASDAFDRELGGCTSFHVVVETDSRDAFKQPENLEELRSLQIWLDSQPEVGKTTSFADYLMVVNRAFHDGDPDYFSIPERKQTISQFLFFLWSDGLKDLVTTDYSAAHIMVRGRSVNSEGINSFIDRVEARLRELPEPFVGHITGDTVLVGRTMDEIAWGQAVSLSGAILIIFVILLAYFRSFRIALLALIPNTLPVTVYFGTLGLTGVTLNPLTSLIACVVLGIAVDDTIHFMVRFREKADELGDESQAVIAALRSVARPVTSTTAALCAGFLVLAASGLRQMVEFSVLASCMLVFAWLVDVTFTPALCARLGVASKAPGPEREAGSG
uniref:Transporter n=1 Tax=uncultured bacterium N27-1E TaxID=1497526 RepID=A0A059U112_9BACT|nr:transporter [uncultured bacterium N27-1E]